MRSVSWSRIFISGVVATAAMSALMLGEPLLGLPQIPVGWIIGWLLDLPAWQGWVLHFVLGVAFAWMYDAFLNERIPIRHNGLRGVVWGLGIYAVAVVLVFCLKATGQEIVIPKPEPTFFLGYGLCHVVFGYVLGLFFVRRGDDGRVG